MFENALKIASSITNPITASAFAVAFLGIALYLVVKSKNKPIAWLLAAGLILVGLAPLAASTYVTSRGIYRIRVTVLGLDNLPAIDANVSTSVSAEKEKTENGWEIVVPPQTKPTDGRVVIYANVPNAYLAGAFTVTLKKDYFPSVEVHLAKLAPVTIRGDVLDENGRAVVGADVTLPDCTLATKTDAQGLFALDSCVAQGEMVRIRAAKGDLSGSVTVPAGNSVEVVLRKQSSLY